MTTAKKKTTKAKKKTVKAEKFKCVSMAYLKAGLPEEEYDYSQWLEFFRKQPAGKLALFERFKDEIPTEGYAALERWQEILENPSKMDKLYQGRLKADNDKAIMDVAVGDDDEEFYEALIRENVQQLNTSNISQQEVARLTQNINIFRKELREIRSRKPKKGTVLEKVLEKAQMPKKPAKTKKPAKKEASKTRSKATVKKKTTKVSSKEKKSVKSEPKAKN